MQKRHYYCFVSGLADLVFDSGKNHPDLGEFREELKANLHPRDYYLVSLLFLPYDNKNLVIFLEGNKDEWADPGNFSHEDFDEQMRILRSVLKGKDILPDYMVRVMSEWINSEEVIPTVEIRKKLADGYTSLSLNSGNRFLEKWVRFDTDLNNIFIFLNAKSLDVEADKYLIGEDVFAGELSDLYRSGKDFHIPVEPDYASEIFKIATESEFIEKERRTDMARWAYIDSITFFEYFTIDLILGYLIKFFIVKRWEKLDAETGKEMLKKLVEDIESNVISGSLSGN